MYLLLNLLHISPIASIAIAAASHSRPPPPSAAAASVPSAGARAGPSVEEVVRAVGTETVLLLARARGMLPHLPGEEGEIGIEISKR